MSKKEYDEGTIIISDRIYIPIESFNARRAEEKYTHWMYKEDECRKCPILPDRHSFECDSCPAFKGAVATHKTVLKNGVEYLGVPIGDRLKIERKLQIDFSQYKKIDLRKKPKFEYPVKMHPKFKLRDHQEKAQAEWWEHKHGLIVAPPRSGKTPLMLHTMIRLGLRGILLANQHEFLQQFIDHVEEYTNLPFLQDKYGIKLYGFPKKLEDFETLQIAACTYQQFMDTAKGRERYKIARTQFGTLFVDEVHKAAANEFAKVINSWPARIIGGVTGTDKRKDCFVEGTPIRMFDGTLKTIENSDVGDEVLTRNNTTLELESKPILLKHKRAPSKSTIIIEHEHGKFECTEDHEIWCVNKNAYVEAKDLTTEDDLLLE